MLPGFFPPGGQLRLLCTKSATARDVGSVSACGPRPAAADHHLAQHPSEQVRCLFVPCAMLSMLVRSEKEHTQTKLGTKGGSHPIEPASLAVQHWRIMVLLTPVFLCSCCCIAVLLPLLQWDKKLSEMPDSAAPSS